VIWGSGFHLRAEEESGTRAKEIFLNVKKKLKLNQGMKMKTKAIYENGVLKPLGKLDLPEKAKVKITIRENFSKLLDEVGAREAKEDIDTVLGNMRTRVYYG
jgi:predicted DNA-binding antitoxin AbrB/MazE fold protein